MSQEQQPFISIFYNEETGSIQISTDSKEYTKVIGVLELSKHLFSNQVYSTKNDQPTG